MPYRETSFEKNQPFHIMSRAVEEKKIFSNKIDCYRFIFQLYAANIGSPVHNIWRENIVKTAKAILEGKTIPSKFIIKEHPPLVRILDFALVATHYHFYLIPNLKNGIPLYMKKLNGGFAKYFNLKYNRKGFLFSSRYQSVAIRTESQSNAVSRYISVINPLDVYQPGWRKEGLKDWKKAFDFLKNYQFSSFPEKIGKRKSKIIAPEKILDKHIPGVNSKNKNDYIDFVKDFLKQKSDFPQEILLE